VSVRITGLRELQERLRTVSPDLTSRRRVQEGQEIVGEAEAISPRDTNNFADSWDFSAPRTSHTLQVTNDARDPQGRPYAEFVHPKGKRKTTAETVREFALQRQPQLAEDLSQIVSDHLNGE
tara:strand:+ start:1427 stop:1792 length:366 start_codon:yes stop_codon:yes gene_type:complete